VCTSRCGNNVNLSVIADNLTTERSWCSVKIKTSFLRGSHISLYSPSTHAPIRQWQPLCHWRCTMQSQWNKHSKIVSILWRLLNLMKASCSSCHRRIPLFCINKTDLRQLRRRTLRNPPVLQGEQKHYTERTFLCMRLYSVAERLELSVKQHTITICMRNTDIDICTRRSCKFVSMHRGFQQNFLTTFWYLSSKNPQKCFLL